jgi:hypothetical protein
MCRALQPALVDGQPMKVIFGASRAGCTVEREEESAQFAPAPTPGAAPREAGHDRARRVACGRNGYAGRP